VSHPPKHRPSDAEAIEARAAAWMAQRDEGLTPSERREFKRWQESDPRHGAAVARLGSTWSLLHGAHELRPEIVARPDRDLLAPPRRSPPRFVWPALAAAAAIAVLVTSVALWSLERDRMLSTLRVTTQQYTTPAGGYERVTLADGSIVELNASTELNVSYTPTDRRVRLARGEAHFTVAKNKHRPFWVEAGGMKVRAVGTAFNVRLGQTQVEVLVTEGRVRVDHAAAASTLIPAVNRGAAAELGAGERAEILISGHEAASIQRLSEENMRRVLAWRYGPRLDFTNTPLAQVVDQFNRRNHVQLELGDTALGTEPVGGSFQAENVEAFVQLLTTERDIVAERVGADRIVLRKAR
jgi:transmembrane sensor